MSFSAIDGDGPWATIEITRGPDTGGYALHPIDPEQFVLEVVVSYAVYRIPASGSFGVDDWVLVFADDLRPAGRVFEPRQPPDPGDVEPGGWPLGRYTCPGGAVLCEANDLVGTIHFLVDRSAADRRLSLVFRPGAARRTAPIVVREPGPAPDPVAAATPRPTPAPVTYVEVDGLPFTVIESMAADSLFDGRQRCANAATGHSIDVPVGWHEVDCTWFGPVPFEVDDPLHAPPEAVIAIEVADGFFGFISAPEIWFQQHVIVDGASAVRREEVGTHFEGGGFEPQPPTYGYFAYFGEDGTPPSLRAMTSSEAAGHDARTYILHKAILDRMIASFTLDR